MENTIVKTKICTGCSACLNICPKNAIKMELNNEGFFYPHINTNLCIHCGLCLKICPTEHLSYKNKKRPLCLAAGAKDNLRKESSSGAIFPLLSELILQNKGYICGAAFDERNKLNHIIIDNIQDLSKLKGSKYVQSDLGNCFCNIKDLLQQNKYVLFSGTPCQVAGLYSFLQKDYENLLTVDIICHGVPSPSSFEKYTSDLLKEKNEKITSINFRDKKEGWTSYYFTIQTNKNTYSSSNKQNPYICAFLKNLNLRQSCSQCPFSRFPRQGDITLGDFWLIEKVNPKLNDELGTSLVLLNSKKGEKYFNDIIPHLKFYQKVPIKYAIKENSSLVSPSLSHPKRKDFFARLQRTSFSKNVLYCQGLLYDCAILNFWFSSNYGALLTCYALQESIKDLGYIPKVINYVPPKITISNTISEYFSEKYLDMTHQCKDIYDLHQLTQRTDTFIVGSDQVWRHKYMQVFGKNIYQLNFVPLNAKKIAYAASFGLDYWEGGYEDTLLTKYYISRVDHISVREDDGVDICRNTFGQEATHVLDPVFLTTMDRWQRLLDNSNCHEQNYIASYVLDKSSDSIQTIDYVCEQLGNRRVVNMVNASRNKTNISVEDWLYYIKNCRFFITDSFHGLCFAIIFNKPFICLANKSRGYSRFRSLLEMLGLQNRCFDNFDDIKEYKDLFTDIDYKTINKILDKERQRCLKWLEDAINSPQRQYSTEQQRFMEIAEVIRCQNIELQKEQKVLYNRILLKELKRKYIKYKIKTFFSFGKRHKRYKKQKEELKEQIRNLKKQLKNNN